MRVLTAAVTVSAVLAGGVLGDSPRQVRQSQSPPLRLWISHAGLTERATLGSFCRQSPESRGGSTGGCGDAGYPLPTRGRLPVRPGSRVVVRSSVDASGLQVHLIRPKGTSFERAGRKLEVTRLSAHRWAVELPARLRGARVLDVFLRWANASDGQGDADFWGAIRDRCG